MKTTILRLSLLLAFFCGNQLQAQIQQGNTNTIPQTTRILFLLDGSGSMTGQMGNSTRWALSVGIMNKIIDSLRTVQNVEVALRVFGHNKPITQKDCYDTKLEVPFSPNNHKAFKQGLSKVMPLGYTSITNSMLAAAKDFPQDKNARNILIIITDGIEECGGDPCAVSAELQKKGIFLQPFIVGVGTSSETFSKQYSCAGRYYNAETEEEYNKVMGIIINQALNRTSVQINLLDNQNLPLETNVPISVYDAVSGQLVANFIHTMNGKNVPDTMYLDPIRTYNIVVHTLPQIIKSGVEIIPGRHNTVAIDAAQGDLELKVEGITKYGRLQCIVRQDGKTETINAQDFNTRKKYLVGTYDLEILTVPRLYIQDVTVRQNQTKTILIPAPGKLELTLAKDMVAQVFQVIDNKMVWVMDLDASQTKQSFTMQPGDYKVVARTKSETRTVYSFTREFKITSGSATFITL